MTDHQPLGRIDLSALDEPADPQQVDRVVTAVLRRVTSEDRFAATDLLSRLGTLTRPMIAAAAILLACATAAWQWKDHPPAGTPLASLRSWADARRVPTNGELLAAFKGYEK